MFFGKAKKVTCFTGNIVHDYKSEDAAVATLQFKSGPLLQRALSSVSPITAARTCWSSTDQKEAFWQGIRSARATRAKWLPFWESKDLVMTLSKAEMQRKE